MLLWISFQEPYMNETKLLEIYKERFLIKSLIEFFYEPTFYITSKPMGGKDLRLYYCIGNFILFSHWQTP